LEQQCQELPLSEPQQEQARQPEQQQRLPACPASSSMGVGGCPHIDPDEIPSLENQGKNRLQCRCW